MRCDGAETREDGAYVTKGSKTADEGVSVWLHAPVPIDIYHAVLGDGAGILLSAQRLQSVCTASAKRPHSADEPQHP